MRSPENLINKVFGKITITSFDASKRTPAWFYECSCGKTGSALASNIKKGSTRSCGCGIGEARNKSANDITGYKFGDFTVTKKLIINNRTRWECVCVCGTVREFTYNYVTSVAKSCGCKSDNSNRGTHRKTNTAEYRTYQKMKSRCYNTNDKSWINYGGRGISICDKWLNSFENFYNDIGPKPTRLHSIDRIDNNRGYSPENCRWATAKEQAENRRSNIVITYNNKSQTLKQWAKELNIKYTTVYARIFAYGWSIDDAFIK